MQGSPQVPRSELADAERVWALGSGRVISKTSGCSRVTSSPWAPHQCLTGKSVRKMKETYSTEDYATVPGYDMLTTENQEAARVAFNKALAQQEIMDSVKNQAEAEKAE